MKHFCCWTLPSHRKTMLKSKWHLLISFRKPDLGHLSNVTWQTPDKANGVMWSLSQGIEVIWREASGQSILVWLKLICPNSMLIVFLRRGSKRWNRQQSQLIWLDQYSWLHCPESNPCLGTFKQTRGVLGRFCWKY